MVWLSFGYHLVIIWLPSMSFNVKYADHATDGLIRATYFRCPASAFVVPVPMKSGWPIGNRLLTSWHITRPLVIERRPLPATFKLPIDIYFRLIGWALLRWPIGRFTPAIAVF